MSLHEEWYGHKALKNPREFGKAPENSLDATAAILKALQGFAPGRNLDIALLNEASPLLKQIVASQGFPLYARSLDDALQFELYAMHDYEYSRHVVRLGQELALRSVHL